MSDEAKHGAVTTLSEAAQVSLPETPSTPATDAKLPEAEAKEAERSVPEPTFPPAIGGSYVSRDAQSVMLDPSDSIHVSSENLKHSEALRGTTSTSSLRTPTAATANTESCKDMPSPSQIYGVVLVDFDHALGPKIEWSSPASLKDEHRSLNEELPFLALPDGAHAREMDYSYFHLFCPSLSHKTVFGISCNRQISADKLRVKASGVTRSTVQKAVVVLASQPVFGPIRDKLGVITQALFDQMDFADTSILEDFHQSLEGQLLNADFVEENVMNMGTSLRELVHTFRIKVLQLFKALMLQRRVMFYGSHVERLCTFQYSLVSLIPGLLLALEDAASPELNSRAHHMEKAEELKSSDKRSFLRYLGLPLNVFGAGAFFQPYLPLQQIDNLQAQSYLVGTTNSIFQQQKDARIDLLVNIDTGAIDIFDPSLAVMISPTPEDRAWMDEIVRTVAESWNPADPTRPTDMKFVGSDDFLRAKFEEYICAALSSVKFVQFLEKGKAGQVLVSSSELNAGLSTFNEAWIAGFQTTPAFAYWDHYVDPVIFDLVEPRHPAQGSTSVLSDVGLRLMQGVHDLKLDEHLGPARELVGKGIQSGTQSVWGMVSAVRKDLAKRQQAAAAASATAKEEKRKSSGSASFVDPAAPAVTSAHVMSQVGDYASSWGSYLSNKRNTFFSGPATPSTSEFANTQTAADVSTPKVTETPAGQGMASHQGSSRTSISGPPTSVGSLFRMFSSPAAVATPAEPGETAQGPVATSSNIKDAQAPTTPSMATSLFRRFSGDPSPQPPKQGGPLRELSLASKTGGPVVRSPRLSPSLQSSPKLGGKGSRRTSTASNASSGSRLSSHAEGDSDYVNV